MPVLSDKEKKEIEIMNSIAGFNPTGQMTLKNGIFLPQGNPAQVVSITTLQKQSLSNIQNNTLNTQSLTPTTIQENFTNSNKSGYNINLLIVLLMISIFVLYKHKH